MRSAWRPAFHLACVAGLFLACFGPVLFRNEQFSYRDAAHYYYPLHQRVQQEWDAGRIPLWEPEENAGMPLLGNPTAAVLYPGKALFFLMPYPWAAKAYVLAHLLLAAGAMWLLLKHWEISPEGRMIGMLSYAFGMPVLFQYCNVIFLVGAAWLPLGVRACDRWLRLGRRWGLAELAVVLALQTLGGDPETAYVLGVAAGGYAWMLSRRDGRRRPWLWLGLPLGLVVWIALCLVGAYYVPIGVTQADAWLDLARRRQTSPFAGMATEALVSGSFWRRVVLGIWLIVGLRVLFARRSATLTTLRRRLLGLGWAGLIALGLIGAQLLPILEYTSRTLRAAEEIHELFGFSLEPPRLVEFFWPNVLGVTRERNRLWLPALVPDDQPKIWIPSLYLGAITMLLAFQGMAGNGNGNDDERGENRAAARWLRAIAFVSLLGALGTFASPVWAARYVPAAAERLGPHDPIQEGEMRRDGLTQDGFGSPYWLMAQCLPGFRSFRYPCKLLTFTSLALSGLAAIGFDRVQAGRARRAVTMGALIVAVGCVLLGSVWAFQGPLVAFWQQRFPPSGGSTFGPFDAPGALYDLFRGLLHGTLLIGLSLGLIGLRKRLPRVAGLGLVLLTTIDLGIANASWILSCPQALFDARPKALEIIEAAERAAGSTEPYRVHRMPVWEPIGWRLSPSSDRVRDFMEWERRTIQPKYAIPYGLDYTLTQGVTELFDYWFFFAPFYRTVGPDDARVLRLKAGEEVVYYPRRGFDLWNTKYFVLPAVRFNEEHRGIYTLQPETVEIAPLPSRFEGPDGDERRKSWGRDEDWQILRNERAFPRAWVVHDHRIATPITGMARKDRQDLMERIIYDGDSLWNSEFRTRLDFTQTAFIESADPGALVAYRPGGPTAASEKPRFLRNEPQHVEIDVTLERAGVLILADVFYPGWNVMVDGRPGTILRANRLMRGVALEAGTHRVVFRYQPLSFRYGVMLSAGGIVLLLATAFWCVASRPERRATEVSD